MEEKHIIGSSTNGCFHRGVRGRKLTNPKDTRGLKGAVLKLDQPIGSVSGASEFERPVCAGYLKTEYT